MLGEVVTRKIFGVKIKIFITTFKLGRNTVTVFDGSSSNNTGELDPVIMCDPIADFEVIDHIDILIRISKANVVRIGVMAK